MAKKGKRMEKEIELTILIPALNEEETIEIVIKKAKKWIKENETNSEILVINNGSTDRTKEIAIKNYAKVIDVKERGYGNALCAGIKEARGKYIIMGDADDSYNFLEITDLFEKLKAGNEFVIGNRYHKIEKGAMKWTHRYIGTPLLSYFVRKIYNVQVRDVNCGLRGFEKNKIKKLNLQSKGMEFASEMIIKASKASLKIKEIPINFYQDKRKRKSHLRTIRDGIRHLNIIIKCSKGSN